MTEKESAVESVEHPIDPQIRAEILATLARVEREHGAPMPVINRFIEFHLERLASVAAPAMPEDLSFTILDRLLRDTVLAQTALINHQEAASAQCR